MQIPWMIRPISQLGLFNQAGNPQGKICKCLIFGKGQTIGQAKIVYSTRSLEIDLIENPTDCAAGAEKCDPGPCQTVVSANDLCMLS